MNNIITPKTAGSLMLLILAALLAFHIPVISGFAPSDIIRGGQVDESESNLHVLETISIVVTIAFTAITLVKMGYINLRRFIGSGVLACGLFLSTFFSMLLATLHQVFPPKIRFSGR